METSFSQKWQLLWFVSKILFAFHRKIYWLPCISALTRPRSFACWFTRVTCLTPPSGGTSITSGPLGAWRSSLFRATGNRSRAWTAHLYATEKTRSSRSLKSVSIGMARCRQWLQPKPYSLVLNASHEKHWILKIFLFSLGLWVKIYLR